MQAEFGASPRLTCVAERRERSVGTREKTGEFPGVVIVRALNPA
jgi:hypothetical protein